MKTKLPCIVPLLALVTFLMCTTEYIVAGLLEPMAGDFGVRTSQVGLLITAFAVGMIVGAPVMAVATLRLPKRATLVLALAIFAAGHVPAALSDSFAVVLVARVLTAIVTGAFWSVAAVVATTAAGPAASSRALGVMMSGVGLVPADTPGASAPSVHNELRALRNARLWLVLAATVLVTGGCMATFSFISPLLTDRAGLSLELVPRAFVGFGVGSIIGTNLSGRFADRNPVATFITTAIAGAVILAALIPLSAHPVSAIGAVALLGVATMAVPPVATGLAVQLAAAAPTLAVALTVSAFKAGIASGLAIAGAALDSSLGSTGPATVGMATVTLGLAPLVALAATRTAASPAYHHAPA